MEFFQGHSRNYFFLFPSVSEAVFRYRGLSALIDSEGKVYCFFSSRLFFAEEKKRGNNLLISRICFPVGVFIDYAFCFSRLKWTLFRIWGFSENVAFMKEIWMSETVDFDRYLKKKCEFGINYEIAGFWKSKFYLKRLYFKYNKPYTSEVTLLLLLNITEFHYTKTSFKNKRILWSFKVTGFYCISVCL